MDDYTFIGMDSDTGQGRVRRGRPGRELEGMEGRWWGLKRGRGWGRVGGMREGGNGIGGG